MLVLTRRIGERIIIADDVRVSVLGVKGHQVRIGVEAPDNVTVNREEVYQRELKAKKASTDTRSVGKPVGVLAEIKKTFRGIV